MEDIRLKQIGNVCPNKNRDNPNQGRVYDKEGLSPTLNSMRGGNLQPMVIVENKSIKPNLVGGIGEKKSNNGTQYYQQDRVYDSNTVAMALPATLQGGSYNYMVEESIPIKNATKKGYTDAYAYDFVNLQYPNSETRRGRVGEQIANTLCCTDENGVVVKDNYYLSEKGVKYVLDPKRGMCTDINADVAQTITAKGQSNWTGSFVSEDIESIEKSKTIGNDEPTVIHLKNGETMTSDNNTSNLRIRKLTPKECFRLMGFEDKDVDILVENNISNTQLYKMAGNSIVVDVLEEIFVELLNQYEDVFPIED